MSVIGRSAAISFTAVVVAAGFFHARAAEVPDALNYQGVLRDASDAPADGPHEMVFRFWTAPEGGEELLRDRHEAAGSGAVIVTRGLFSVELGEGVVEDGAGDGDYTSLADVFRAHRDVWLEVQIGDETLAPRTPVAAAAYAFNAAHLGGRRADEFLDGCDANQFKLGRLVVGAASGTTLDFGVEGYGSNGGGHFEDTNGSGFAQVGYGNFGIRAEGNFAGGYFKDLDGSAFGYAGYNNFGFRGVGSTAGGYFSDFETFAVEHVGVSGAQSRKLLSIARAAAEWAPLGAAWRAGEVSGEQVVLLGRVFGRGGHDDESVARWVADARASAGRAGGAAARGRSVVRVAASPARDDGGAHPAPCDVCRGARVAVEASAALLRARPRSRRALRVTALAPCALGA